MSLLEEFPTLEEWLEERRDQVGEIDMVEIFVVRDPEEYWADQDEDDEDFDLYREDSEYAMITSVSFAELIEGLDDEDARPWQTRVLYDHKVMGDGASYNDDWHITLARDE